MVIEDSGFKNASYTPSNEGGSLNDNVLGGDMIYYLNKWRALDEEAQESYSDNRMNYQESKKDIVQKKKSMKKSFHINKKIIAITSFVAIGAVAVGHYVSANYITNMVVESGIFPNLDTMSVRDDSKSGLIISYLDAYGNRQTVNGDYYIQSVVQNGIENGFSADQVAIAMDHLGFCNASSIEGSSLLGRIGQEINAITHLNKKENEQSAGGRKI